MLELLAFIPRRRGRSPCRPVCHRGVLKAAIQKVFAGGFAFASMFIGGCI